MKTTVILFLCLIKTINCINDKNLIESEIKSVDEKWIKTFDQFFKLSKDFGQKYLPTVEKSLSEINISSECDQSIRKIFSNTDEEWVLSMLESSGRLPIGIMSGTITNYGDFDQCLATRGTLDDKTTVTGKYCFLNIRPPLPPVGQTLNLSGTQYENSWIEEKVGRFVRMYGRVANGLCIPSVCSQTEVTQFLRNVFSDFQFAISVEHCSESNQRTPLDWAQLLSIISISALLVAVIIGTIYDERARTVPKQVDNNNEDKVTAEKDSQLKEFFICFSFTTNAKKIFTITESSGETELKILHGLRVTSIFWVILCHTTNFAPLGLYDQPMIAARFKTDGVNVIKHLWTQMIISGSLSVQTFFIISGLISLHTALRYKKGKTAGFNYWQFVLLRWLRFAPPLFGMFCYQFIWPLLGSGPMFHYDFLKYGHDPCYYNWLPSFLFISNWWPLADQCASQTWYLGADFQITLISYFLIIYYIKNYFNAIKMNVWLIVVGIVLPVIINYIYKLPLVHILDPDPEKLSITYSMTEFNTYNHLMAYFTGTLLAGIINSGKQFNCPRTIRNIIWTVLLIGLLLTPFSTYPFIQMDEIPASHLTILYNSIKRLVWVSGIAWIVFACVTFDKNSFISKFLSAKLFQPLSRLTFSIYLTQSLVVWYHGYQTRHLYPIDHYNALFRVGGVAMFSFVFGFILYILFEAPSVNLCKLIFMPKTRKSTTISEDMNNNVEEKQRLNSRIEDNSVNEMIEIKVNP